MSPPERAPTTPTSPPGVRGPITGFSRSTSVWSWNISWFHRHASRSNTASAGTRASSATDVSAADDAMATEDLTRARLRARVAPRWREVARGASRARRTRTPRRTCPLAPKCAAWTVVIDTVVMMETMETTRDCTYHLFCLSRPALIAFAGHHSVLPGMNTLSSATFAAAMRVVPITLPLRSRACSASAASAPYAARSVKNARASFPRRAAVHGERRRRRAGHHHRAPVLLDGARRPRREHSDETLDVRWRWPREIQSATPPAPCETPPRLPPSSPRLPAQTSNQASPGTRRTGST